MTEILRNVIRRERVLLCIVFLLALFLRFWNLSSVPYGFHRDEVANTYIGRFILLNGQDIYGNPWPLLYVDKFGDYPPVLPMYLSGASTFLFGVNEFSARVPSALIGSLIIFPLFGFLAMLFNRRTAIAGAALIAVLPWHVVLSRSSAEGIIGLTICVWGITLAFSGVRDSRPGRLVGAIVLLLSTYLLYPSFRIIVPLILLPLPFFFVKGREKINRKAALILAATVIATLWIMTTPWGKGRFVQTSLFSNRTEAENIQNNLIAHIFSDGGHPAFLTRVFHNKIVAYGQRFLELYIGYFSPSIYFIKGGLPARYVVPHVALIPITVGLSMLLYFLFPITGIDRKRFLYMVYLLMVAPLPAVLTVDDWPNIHRGIFMIIPIVGLGAISIVNILQHIGQKSFRYKRLAMLCIAGMVCAEAVYSSHQYFAHAGTHNSYERNDGNIQMAKYLIDHKGEYDKMYVTLRDWLPLYYLFYSGTFDRSLVGSFKTDFALRSIDTVEFEPYPCVSHERLKFFTQESREHILVIDNSDCTVPQEYTRVDVITRKGGTEAYRVLAPIRKL